MATFKSAQNFEKFGIVVAVGFLVFSLLGTYNVYHNYVGQFKNTKEVLGAKTVSPSAQAQNSCLTTAQIATALKGENRTVTLYAPDKTMVLPLESIAECFVNTGCDASGVSCSDVKTTMDVSCLNKHFEQYPLALTTTVIMTRNDVSVKVRKEDWTVNYKDLSSQLADAISKEVTYCQLAENASVSKKNIANIQLTVSDATASVEESFTKRFIEIDKNKQILYFWNDGIYQPYYIKRGARLPAQQIYLRKDIDIQRLLQSIDAGYILRNSSENDYVVVHE